MKSENKECLSNWVIPDEIRNEINNIIDVLIRIKRNTITMNRRNSPSPTCVDQTAILSMEGRLTLISFLCRIILSCRTIKAALITHKNRIELKYIDVKLFFLMKLQDRIFFYHKRK